MNLLMKNKNSKKAFVSIGVFAIMLSSIIAITPKENVFASSEYKTPSGDELDSLFETDLSDITRPIPWLSDRHTFCIIEEKGDKDYAWINVPNLWNLIWNNIDDNVAYAGFDNNATNISENDNDHLYKIDSNGSTAMQRLGFHIPSLKYYGEYPFIQYNPKGVVPTGFWGQAKATIKGFFGDSVTEAPDGDNFNTLTYYNLHDYIDNYQIVKWIENNWNNIDWESNASTGLLSKSICGNDNSTVNGIVYNVTSCVISPGLETYEGSAQKFNKKLMANWGNYYNEIMKEIIAMNDSSVTSTTLRVMPYTTDNLYTSGNIDVSLAKDPRSDVNSFFSLHPSFLQNFGLNISKFGITLSSLFSELSYEMNQISSLNFLKSKGIDLGFLYRSTAFKAIAILFAIIFSGKMVRNVTRFLYDGSIGSIGTILAKSLCMGFISITLFAIAVSPDSFVRLFKTIVNLDQYFTVSMTSNTDLYNDYCSSSATTEEKVDLTYWIPYFETWTYYNTNHSLDENKINTDNTSNEPEQSEMKYCTIDGEEIYSWSYTLARSFTTSNKINSNAYRVVDHFMAPRLNISYDNSTISSTTNENYNGNIQTRSGWNWLICLGMFLAQLLKTIFFFALVFEFLILFISLLNGYIENNIKERVLGFLIGILEYWATSLIVIFASNMTTIGKSQFLSSAMCLIFIIALIYFFLKAIKSMKYKPKFLNRR